MKRFFSGIVKRGFYILPALVVTAGVIAILGSGGGGGGGASKAGLTGGGTGGGAGYGGAGGDFNVGLNGGTGALTLKKSGTVDTSFTMPSMDNYSTGDNPLVVDANTTIAALAEGAAKPAAGVPYLIVSDEVAGSVWISDGFENVSTTGSGGDTLVTGIEVLAGKTLTLGLNGIKSRSPFSNISAADVEVSGDIVNRGTITTLDENAAHRGWLELVSDDYYGFSGSRIDTRGTQDGQHGGFVYIYPATNFYNRGNIYSNGADSSVGDGGVGGYVEIYNDTNPGEVYNTGNVYTYGGKSETGNGGHGHALILSSDAEPTNVYNSGDFFGYGGDGYINGGEGGSGGPDATYGSYMEAWSGGSVTVSGDIDIHGGTGKTGTGGHSAEVGISSDGYGDVLVSGVFNLRGGDALGVDQDGGNAGTLYIETYGNSGVSGSIETSARVDVSGGNADDDAASTGNGGVGGNVTIEVFSPDAAEHITVITPQVNTSGGDGGIGGTGGAVDIFNDGSGALSVGNDITTDGGKALTTTHNGGDAGDVWVTRNVSGDITVDGNINAIGGDSFDSVVATVGVGGAVEVSNVDPGNTTLNGTIDASGGDDKNGDDAGVGNNAGSVSVTAQSGNIENNGRVYTNGGNGDVDGGKGGAQVFWSNSGTVTNNGRIDTSGGDGTSGNGGDGGCIDVPVAAVDNGTIDQSGGTGGSLDGAAGGECPK